MSPQEILDTARQRVPSLGLATVYRAVRALTEEGVLQPVELPGEAPRYEKSGQPHHHHFLCKECHRVYPVPGCPGELTHLAPLGFETRGHEIVLYGRCPDCAQRPSGGRPRRHCGPSAPSRAGPNG